MDAILLLFLFLCVSCCNFRIVLQKFSESIPKTNCIPRIIQSKIASLQWRDVIMIHGINDDDFIPYSIKQQRYNIDDVDVHTILKGIHTSTFPNINIVIAVNDTWIQEVLNQIDKFDLTSNGTTDFRHHSKIIVLMENISRIHWLENSLQHLENVAVWVILRDSCNKSNEEMSMYTVHIHPMGRVLVPISEGEQDFLVNMMFPNAKYGYNNRLLTVTTLESGPYVLKKIVNGTTFYTGYIFDIWEAIANRLNFSYNITEPDDGNWGIYENGQWNGMVGQLIRKEVDVATADISVYHGRAFYIDYVFPAVMVDRTDIMYARQPSSENAYSLLLRPLRIEVYVVFLAVFVGIIIVYAITDYHSWLNNLLTCNITLTGFRSELSNISWEFTGTTLRQEFKLRPRRYAGKVLLSSWCILVLIITSVYSANLIAALSSQTGLFKFSSIDELVDSDYTTGMFTVGMPFEIIKTSRRPELKRLFSKMVESSKYDSGIFLNDLDSHMTRVKTGKHALIMYRSTAEKYMAEDCHLALIGEPITWSAEYITFALPKGSPLKTDIEKSMYVLRESGILDMLWRKWTAGHNASSCIVDRQVTVITMREMAGGCLVVCGGVGLSLVILVVELCQRYPNALKRSR